MAVSVRLTLRVDDLIQDCYTNILDAEDERSQEYKAARRIQAWFRSCRIRRYIGHLAECAVTIQRHWRGFIARRRSRKMLSEAVFQMRLKYYNETATSIQKVWKGFYTRKYVFDYYKRKAALEDLVERNKEVRCQLADYEESQRIRFERQKLEQLEQEKIKWAKKNHHLVSTATQPSIYNSPYYRRPKSAEILLREVLPDPVAASCGVGAGGSGKAAGEAAPLPPLTLPPKPQGPFRPPQDVFNQRYKPPKPSLRVQSDFYGLEKAREELRQEEWAARLYDDIFMPVRGTEKPYERTLVSNGNYGHLPYGTKYFREERVGISQQNRFQTILPPIAVFDKLNDQYVEGYVEN